jgi:hypothetical protein
LESKVGLLLFDDSKLKKREGLEETSSLYTYRQDDTWTPVRGPRAEMSTNGWAYELGEAVEARGPCGEWLRLATRSMDLVPQIRSVWRSTSSDEARGSGDELMRLVGARGGSRRFAALNRNKY